VDRRRARTLGAALVVLLVAAFAATRLPATGSSELLVKDGSPVGEATRALDRTFGEEPIVVVVKGDLQGTLGPGNLGALAALEGRIARIPGVKAVYGPGTFVNQTVSQATQIIRRDLGASGAKAERAALLAGRAALAAGKSQEEALAAANAASKRVLGEKNDEYRRLMVRFGTIGAPSIFNRNFVNALVFGLDLQPKRRFRWLFPDAGHALILVRPRAGLGQEATLAIGDRLRSLTAKSGLQGVRFDIAGSPLLAAALERETRSELLRLMPIALGAMLVLLLLVLRRRRGRFVPLALALAAVVVVLGLSWPLGLGLTVATVAAMPVILGLGLDFAIQIQARYWSARNAGSDPAAAALQARSGVGPTLLLAAGAMAIGFLVLLASSVPLLDRLGLVLALGAAAAVVLAIVVGPELLVALDRGPVAPVRLPAAGRLGRLTVPPIVLSLIGGAALAGLVVSHGTTLQSDLNQLAPSSLRELRDVQTLQRELGTSGQVSVAVRAPDVTDPRVVEWIDKAQGQILRDARLRPGPNVADLVTGGVPGLDVDRQAVDGVLRVVPAYFRDAVISRDRSVAQLSFGVPFVSVAEQGRIVDRIEAALRDHPDGVTVSTAGLAAAAAQSTEELDGTRPGLLLLGALLIAAVLLVAWRSITRVALVLAPALVGAGLVAVLLAALDVKLSPLGAALEPLVLAVGLEFGMLLEMRYRQARADGLTPAAARDTTLAEIGGAVTLSAATVAAGFAVLVASRLPLLSQLGWLVALELALSLAVALLLVPALAQAFDGGARRRASAAPVWRPALRKGAR
jgi:predicted RND superfamily exporter protein